jgi:hypothetical protein
MVLTAAQVTAFFTANDQMAMDADTVAQLAVEGIQHPDDLREFEEEGLKQVADNLRRPPGRIPDPDPNAQPGATVPTPPFVFGAKSHARLFLATSELLRFYETIGRVVTAANVQWDTIGRNFQEQWKAIKESKKETQPEVPTITKALPIIRWIEAFQDHCARCIGGRNIPLAYVIRESVDVPVACPALTANQPYSEEHGSILGDLVNRGSHTHGLFTKDNADIYYKLEEATRGTPYADSIKPFQRAKDGRAAYNALVGQYAGTDKWEAEIKKSTNILQQLKWKGNQNVALEKFVAKHRYAYVSLQVCAEHVQYQLPNQHSRVGYILDAIESDDAGLQAAMANVADDTGPGGKRGDFEAAVAYILPKDPVVKRKQDVASGKRNSADISDTTAAVADFGTKAGIGKTGVHLRYHSNPEYKELSKPQQQELREWRKTTGGGKDKSAKAGKGFDPSKRQKSGKALAAAIKKGVEERLEAREKELATENQASTLLQSMVDSAVAAATGKSGKATSGSTNAAAPTILRSILKKAKNGGGD